MRTSTTERIDQLTAAGHWGNDSLHSLLLRNAQVHAARPALKDQPNKAELCQLEARSLTWAELNTAANNLATQLRANGIGEDDIVIVQLPNIVELAVCYYALSKCGAIVSPIPIQYSSHELQRVTATTQAQTVISLDHFKGNNPAATAKAALPEVAVLCFGEELALTTADMGNEINGDPDSNRIITLCWTSGTTGTTKGVPRSHNMWLATARSTLQAGSYGDAEVLLNPFPLVNMAALGGFLFPAALLASTLVLHQPLDLPLYLQQMQNEHITFTIAPPALLNQLAQAPAMWNQFDFSSLRAVGSGSAPLSADMISTFDNEYSTAVVNFYGSNEGISLFATPESAPEPDVRASMFQQPAADSGILTRVVELDSGREMTQPGERGELLISGATVFDGYHDYDNSDVFDDGGYFRTGDLVEICGTDRVSYKIVGRCKDIINRGGMKISPAELDLALEQHPDFDEAAVCAYPDQRLGEKICACLVIKQGSSAPTVEQLQHYMLGMGFAKFKLPERIERFDALPRNPLGKVRRFELEAQVSKA